MSVYGEGRVSAVLEEGGREGGRERERERSIMEDQHQSKYHLMTGSFYCHYRNC